jgi:urease accessory protein
VTTSLSSSIERPTLDGHIEIVVRSDGSGGNVYPTLRSSGALAARATIDGISLVGASAHPIGGDNLRVDIDVGTAAHLSVRSASATLARSSTPPAASHLKVTASVRQGATLHWAPEPGIAAQGSRHLTEAVISLDETASLYWSDVIVLGRVGESAGSWGSRLRVEVAGQPLVVSELELGPAFAAWSSAAVLGGARCVHSVILVKPGRQAPGPSTLAHSGYLVPLSECAMQIVTWGSNFLDSRTSWRALLTDPALTGWMDGALSVAVLQS